MLLKRLDDMRLSDLQSIIGVVREGKTIEFKREMPAKTNDEVVKFLAAVSSLANTAGGDLLIGMEAKDGVATVLISTES
ncbi:helix-turn-helix domain-containing protein [Methylovirgula sp. HY1]|uniref:AlbA family DNA-binding domain-containing protein n=1 Tax=Methylovirgula sp. HY1 TaxID=2822761 RepID=UPI001C5BEFEA|nr:RNA-binding domain-containing protein [Methylovirgula sp. HY1]QXX76037.1 hypothetical protein MHY1_02872 [Methylovirgula sp. HY1]